MLVKLKERSPDYPDLSNEPYFVIGIEADDFRILNDCGSLNLVIDLQPEPTYNICRGSTPKFQWTLNKPAYRERPAEGI
jgi:hypothetical protein